MPNEGRVVSKADWIFLIIGLLAMAVGVLVLVTIADQPTSETIGNAVVAIALAIVTVVVLNALWGLMGGDPVKLSIRQVDSSLQELRSSVELVSDSYASGLRRVYTRAADFGTADHWVRQLEPATVAIDLMGYTLRSWYHAGDTFAEQVSSRLKSGVQVRILLMDPGNELFGRRERPEITHQNSQALRADLDVALNAFREIAKKLHDTTEADRFEVRTVTKGSIKWHVCRTDDRMIAVPYLGTEVGAGCPLFDLRRTKGGLFGNLEREFTRIWESGQPLVAE